MLSFRLKTSAAFSTVILLLYKSLFNAIKIAVIPTVHRSNIIVLKAADGFSCANYDEKTFYCPQNTTYLIVLL